MVRTKSPARRDALLAAAARAFATEGLGASTASIAKEAGVSTGSLFVYFDSKAVLVNELYVALKTEMAAVATAGLTEDMAPREQLRRMWDGWMAWATAEPHLPRAMAHLGVAEDLTPESHEAVRAAYAGIAALLRDVVAEGPLRDVPLGFVTSLMSAIADTTMDDLRTNPDPTGRRSTIAFDAMWRALAG